MSSEDRPALYDRIGEGYDATRRADPHIAGRLAAHLGVSPEGRYLDVACGTGNYTAALASLGGCWHGVDASRAMIAAAERKAPSIAWRLADVEALPFDRGAFDGATCTLAVHHFASIPTAFGEIRRVL